MTHSPPRTPVAHLAEALAAGLACAVLALVYLHPMAQLFGSHLAPDPGDPLFNLVVLKWGIHQLSAGFPSFWDLPIFFPEHGMTALSDHLLGPAVAAAAFTAVLPNPVAAYNFLLLCSFALCGASTWFVLRQSGLGRWGAACGAAAFAFSSFRWEQLSHLQILLAGWIPLVLWSFDRLLATPTLRRAGLFLAVYGLHLSGGLYLAYMVHVPLAVLLANRRREVLAALRERGPRRLLLATALAAGAAAAAIFLPYLMANLTFDIARPKSSARSYGATLLSYLNPSQWSLWFDAWPGRLVRPEGALFAGLLPTALAIAALLELGRHAAPAAAAPSRARRLTLAALLAAAGAGLVLGDFATWSVRPSFDLYPAAFVLLAGGLLGWLLLRRRWRGGWPLQGALPDPWVRGLLLAGAVCCALTFGAIYQAAREVLPGLAEMRVPVRFYPFVSLALAFLAGWALDRLLDRFQGRTRAAAGLLVLALVAVDLAPRRVHWVPVEQEADFAPVHAWIAGRPDVQSLLVLPWTDGTAHPEMLEIAAMYHATRHWRPLVDGYSGHFPPFHQRLHQICCWPLPQDEALSRLREAGVTHVLVHVGTLPKRWQRHRVRTWPATGEVELVYDDGPDLVFRILPGGMDLLY